MSVCNDLNQSDVMQETSVDGSNLLTLFNTHCSDIDDSVAALDRSTMKLGSPL